MPAPLAPILRVLGRVDRFVLMILCAVAIAAVVPAHGEGAVAAGAAANVAIGLLFFLYGARLSTQMAIAGLAHWRLHLVVLIATFVLFPLLGIAARVLVPSMLTPGLYAGFLYLCALPSTVQSSIAFTSIARGNVPAAICSASASNLIGIVLTPVMVGLLLSTHGGISSGEVRDILLQLLAPFVAGQLLRRWIGGFVQRNKSVLSYVDRGSILLVVYVAFSEGMVEHIWSHLDVLSLLKLLVVNSVLLALVLGATAFAGRRLGFSREDEIVIVFCGSKKSLASGLPMASVLFPAPQVGLIVLPLMLFHQVQLMVCAALANRYAKRPVGEAVAAE